MKNRILHLIFENKLYLQLVAFLQRIKIGKDKIGLYDAIIIFLTKMSNDEILDRANGVAFSFTMAIFPAIIFLFTLTPYIQNFFPDLTNDEIIGFLENILPANLYAAAETTIHDIISKERGGLLSFGFIMTLILSTNGMTSLMGAFNACYKTIETRGFFSVRLTATGLIFILSISFISSIALLIVGQQLLTDSEIRSIVNDTISVDILFILRFVFLYIIFQFAISSIYYFAPAIHERWHFLSVGSVFSTLAIIMASFGFSYYVNNFGNYNKLYGSIGVLLVFMLWLFIISLILLVGFEMNAAIHKAKMNIRESIE
ncbi:MAG: ribonuclease bn [Cytophagales bacterium CG12_big_fil_rev_8_21_14_0_65_40_12]|nr:MAG: ribonuclease bn [Cytophagales bacterium CG12_big_fil_rev_8_21_14_0_65_40_12]PIW05921.1 MAG: YihY/virulence factor BrkB family protein [Cytophagales bacterium CG17_big_fil_post_rev_8_21_14_2_50_40_13]